MNISNFISQKTNIPIPQINKSISLFENGCTLPFVARYRKDETGNLNEVDLEKILNLKQFYEKLEERKQHIISVIESQGALKEDLKEKIQNCLDSSELEDLYLPYKKEKKTLASRARDNSLEPLAKIIMAQNATDVKQIANSYLNEKVETVEKALEGARHIIAEWINENPFIRKQLRYRYKNETVIKSKVIKSQKNKAEALKYEQYFDWEESLKKIPSHRLLAILRASNLGIVKIELCIDKDSAIDFISDNIIKSKGQCAEQIQLSITDSFKRLISPSLSNEALQLQKEKADWYSINIFSNNLKQLLLAPQLGEKRIMGIDPGFQSGCKLVCLDQNGELLYNETIYPHPPKRETAIAIKKIKSLVNSYKIEAIAIGNGTASRETEFFIQKIAFDRAVKVFVVSEAGASVYSASKIARAEFPNYDITVRGAVSIGRRLADPLAELVKIEPKALGIGQYQHDVNQSLLKTELDKVVSYCVNSVGVNLNTASSSLLSYVSGIGDKLAENIVHYRTVNGAFSNRAELLKVERFGAKAFQQASAFIRVKNSDNPLDNSAIHPEAYKVVEKMARDLKVGVSELIANEKLINTVIPEKYTNADIGIIYIKDILRELLKPGVDIRKNSIVFEFDSNLKKFEDLSIGMVLPGIVTNITNFGCFVDVGIKENGLVHISELKAEFISDVNEVVKLHQHTKVKVIGIDSVKRKFKLSMIL